MLKKDPFTALKALGGQLVVSTPAGLLPADSDAAADAVVLSREQVRFYTQSIYDAGLADRPVAASNGPSPFENMRARTLLAELWRRQDAAGISMGRSYESVVLEAALTLLGDPEPEDMALLDIDSGTFVNDTRTYLSRKMARRLGFPDSPAERAREAAIRAAGPLN